MRLVKYNQKSKADMIQSSREPYVLSAHWYYHNFKMEHAIMEILRLDPSKAYQYNFKTERSLLSHVLGGKHYSLAQFMIEILSPNEIFTSACIGWKNPLKIAIDDKHVDIVKLLAKKASAFPFTHTAINSVTYGLIIV
jgi:hypothetical protein